MTVERVVSVVLGVGSVTFLVAAFVPVSRVFALSDVEAKDAVIAGAPGMWRASQALFALGALVTAAGVAWGMFLLDVTWSRPVTAMPGMLLGVGAALWTWHVTQRALHPEAFTAGTLPVWPFAVYTLLTLVGLALVGWALLTVGSRGLGLTLLIGPALLLLAYARFRDLPPFTHYLLTLAWAVQLLRS